MIKTPYFHQTDPKKLPGQVVYPIPPQKQTDREYTLSDYLQNKYPEEMSKGKPLLDKD